MLVNIQCLRGVAALLVLTFHLIDIGQNFGKQSFLFDFVMFGQSGVDLFFVISGFIIYFISIGKFKNKNYQKKFIIKRFFRIYPTYWFYSILLLLSLYIIGSERINQIDVSYIVNSLLLTPQESFPLLSVGWTLTHEILFYLLFSILLFFDEKGFKYFLIAWFASIIFLSLTDNIEENWLKLIFNPINLEFIFGCIIAILIEKTIIIKNGKYIISIGIACLIIFSSTFYNIYKDVPVGIARTLIFGLPSAIIVYGSILLEKENILYNNTLINIGNASYSIYLSHVIVIWVLATLFRLVTGGNYCDNALALILFFITCILFGIMSYITLEKFILKIGKNIAYRD